MDAFCESRFYCSLTITTKDLQRDGKRTDKKHLKVLKIGIRSIGGLKINKKKKTTKRTQKEGE